jgi:hypothetical protein
MRGFGSKSRLASALRWSPHPPHTATGRTEGRTMNASIDLVTVLGNTFSNVSWSGFTFMCAMGLVAALWCVMPFAVFGVKQRLDRIEQGNRAQTDALLAELRRMNDFVARLPRTVSDRPALRRAA